MNNTVTQMAAISAAMRKLLSNDPLAKPDDLLIAATDGLTEALVEMMMSQAASNCSTFLAIFEVEDQTALLEKVLVVDASTTKGQINIGAGKFVQKSDGSFAVLSANREEPYEYRFSRSGRRLLRRAVEVDSSRAAMEIRGLQALLAKAASAECQAEALQRSVSFC